MASLIAGFFRAAEGRKLPKEPFDVGRHFGVRGGSSRGLGRTRSSVGLDQSNSSRFPQT